MRWLVFAVIVAGCDKGERPPPRPSAPPPQVSPSHPSPPPSPSHLYGSDSFIEVDGVTVSDIPQPSNRRRITISGDGMLTDEREQETHHRQVSARRFAELVQELEKAGVLNPSGCMRFDHGRHTKLTLSVPEGKTAIRDATTCDGLREPIRHITELAD